MRALFLPEITEPISRRGIGATATTTQPTEGTNARR
jgi:hypothetical protein